MATSPVEPGVIGGTGPTRSSTRVLLDGLGRRYAATGRCAVAVCVAAIAPLAAPPAGAPACTAVVAALVGWNLVHLRVQWRAPSPGWSAADTAVVIAVCLAQRWLVDPDRVLDAAGWISIVAATSVMVGQWHTGRLGGALLAVTVSCSWTLGAVLATQATVAEALTGNGAWFLVQAALARALWELVRRAGGEADQVLAQRSAARQGSEVAAARRADQRAHWATVHDTAATTLLMIGTGAVRGRPAWLAAQARRDLHALAGAPTGSGSGSTDLAALVTATALAAPVAVDLDAGTGAPVPARVADALAGAVAESLENVRRHAGTGRAAVSVFAANGTVAVRVVDAGAGFDPDRIPSGRWGLRRSVVDRVHDAGGRAEVVSAPGAGTSVRLVWPRG